MGNKIFETILNRKIENFVSTFVEDSRSIFFNENLQLFHPGEYGKYRENSIKDLLQVLTKYRVSDGFIITSKNNQSTQCDIVIYDNSDFPVLENNFTQFFSIESVIAIGEVKSTLNKRDFSLTLKKLAENKKLANDIDGIEKQKRRGVEYDLPISFLVCKNLSFDIESVNFADIYGDLPQKYWHNVILCVDQGMWTYQFKFENLKEPYRSNFISKGGNIETIASIETPNLTISKEIYECEPSLVKIIENTKFYHIKMFLTAISQAISQKTLYETQILTYIDLPQIDFYKK